MTKTTNMTLLTKAKNLLKMRKAPQFFDKIIKFYQNGQKPKWPKKLAKNWPNEETVYS